LENAEGHGEVKGNIMDKSTSHEKGNSMFMYFFSLIGIVFVGANIIIMKITQKETK